MRRKGLQFIISQYFVGMMYDLCYLSFDKKTMWVVSCLVIVVRHVFYSLKILIDSSLYFTVIYFTFLPYMWNRLL